MARVHRLTLTHFRNYRAATLEADAGRSCWSARTAPARPICIEAISFLSPGRGLRRATLDDVADHQGDGSWAVSAEVEGALGLATLGTGIERALPKMSGQPAHAGSTAKPVASAAAFGDHLRMVWLTPAMDGLFIGAPSERRRFFDRLVLAIDGEHRPGLRARPRAASRNRLLRSAISIDHWCDAIERETAELAVAVAAVRADAVSGSPPCWRAARTRAFRPPRSRSTAGWKSFCPRIRRSRWRTATATSCATIAPATPRPAARSTARI